MSDPTPSFDDWTRQWLEGQQQAWQAWLGGATATPPQVDPAAAMTAWIDGATPGGEVAERLLAQGRQFMQLAEALGETLAATAADDAPPDWQAVFDATLARVRATLEPNGDGNVHPAGALGGLLGEWQKLATELGPTSPGDDATAAYLAALNAYAARLADIQRDALDRLKRELDEQHAAGATITSLRALYDLWVDASEAAYAEQAPSRAFAGAQAELAHALCRLHAAGAAR